MWLKIKWTISRFDCVQSTVIVIFRRIESELVPQRLRNGSCAVDVGGYFCAICVFRMLCLIRVPTRLS